MDCFPSSNIRTVQISRTPDCGQVGRRQPVQPGCGAQNGLASPRPDTRPQQVFVSRAHRPATKRSRCLRPPDGGHGWQSPADTSKSCPCGCAAGCRLADRCQLASRGRADADPGRHQHRGQSVRSILLPDAAAAWQIGLTRPPGVAGPLLEHFWDMVWQSLQDKTGGK